MSGRVRYVVLGLAPARSEWFRLVGQWASTGSLPLTFLKCVSAEELRVRLRGSAAVSAVLLDGAHSRVDRDLLAAVREVGVPAFVVDGGARDVDWRGLGAADVLPAELTREVLLDVLATHALTVGQRPVRTEAPSQVVDPFAGRGVSVAVTGAGGTGASTVAIGLAQGLGAHGARILLMDGCLHAELAALHDTGAIVPGLQELVEAHRSGTPTPETIRSLTFRVEARAYDLLLGLRRARFWSSLQPSALAAALGSVRSAYDVVVADVDPDLEGEDEAGSIDVEERHMLARTIVGHADVVVVVGSPGLKGTFSLVRVIDDIVGSGTDVGRIVPVVNRAPRSVRHRRELARGLAELVGADRGLTDPVFLPERRVDVALRDGAPLPAPLPKLLVDAYAAALERVSHRPPGPGAQPVHARVAPGSLGALADGSLGDVPWSDDGGAPR